jgi:hypothetical protein
VQAMGFVLCNKIGSDLVALGTLDYRALHSGLRDSNRPVKMEDYLQ